MDGISDIKLSDCWAKTDPATGKPALTVRDHSIAALAVAQMVLPRLAPLARKLPPCGTVALIGVHDVGKISPGFLRKATSSRFSVIPGWQDCCGNHALIGQEFLASLSEMRHPNGKPFSIALAIGGHHGRYPTTKVRNLLGKSDDLYEGGYTWPDELRRELLREIIDLAGPLPEEDVANGPRLHWLTGLVVFCDWIASNTDWFPLSEADVAESRWSFNAAKTMASNALDTIGWHRREIRDGRSFSDCFGHDSFRVNTLQSLVLELVDQPGLYIIEAPMGSGKTEAALAAAYKRWTTGDERGLYFALPTQLTSNRIHDRIKVFLLNTIQDEQSVQTLVHGNAWLSEERARNFVSSTTPGESSDASEACRWFASARKALLAPFGTGTVDQSLMAVLSSKHSALRLFSLSGKVVVIDEVHSYDPYTSALVDRLISWLLEVGCSVIVLSATLTAARRHSLVNAGGAVEPPLPPEVPYPLVTKVISGAASHHALPGHEAADTHVRIEIMSSELESDMLVCAAEAAERGACVLIIRNTVVLAQETYRRAKEALHGDHLQVGLIHSRFPHERRMENEAEWTELLGKPPSPSRPQGCILVATQVVEQSVDIDADLLISDLAPTELILQRIGRLHRHSRPRPSGFETPVTVLMVPSVNWEGAPDVAKAALGPSAWVYPPIALYHAEVLWKNREQVTLPSGIRALLEHPLPSPLPSAAQVFKDQLERETSNMLTKAAFQDAFRAPAEDDQEGVVTRYNMKPEALLVILDSLPAAMPPIFNYDLAKHLHEHAARVPQYRLRGALGSQPSWFTAQIENAVLAIRHPHTTRLEIHGQEHLSVHIDFHDDHGITFETVSNANAVLHEPEDFWF